MIFERLISRLSRTRASHRKACILLMIQGLMLCGACSPRAYGRQTGWKPAQRPLILPSKSEQGSASILNPRFPVAAEEGVTFAQATDARPLDLSLSGGKVAFIWSGATTSKSLGSKYYPMDRDMDRSHGKSWYRGQLADAVAYRCDGKTMATTFTYSWGSYTPIDVTNPYVRDYVFKTYMKPTISRGERVIALDNVMLRNPGKRCGVYRDGKWTQLFSGEIYDPAYEKSVLDWIGWLRDRIHAAGGQLALNAKVEGIDVEKDRRLISLADIWLQEAGFTRNCEKRVSDDRWRARMDLSRWAAERMPWVDLDKSCASPDQLDDDEAQWIVANFLLAKGAQSFLGVVHDGESNRLLRYPATLNPPVGHPVAGAVPVNRQGMMRLFSNGLVVVNPSSRDALMFDLPKGDWKDIQGETVPGTLRLAPTSAAVLLKDLHLRSGFERRTATPMGMMMEL